MISPLLSAVSAGADPSTWATLLDLRHAGEFLSKFTELYLDSFMANVMIGLLLGALGLFVILRRIVFLSAALSQVSGAGLALAFFLGTLWAHQTPTPEVRPIAPPGERLDNHVPEDDADRDIQDFLDDEKKPGTKKTTGPPPEVPQVSPSAHHGRHEPISPILLSLLITVIVALLLSESSRGRWRSTQESVVGLVFIVASAASIILAQMAEKGAHEIAELLFGTVIFIPPDQQHLIYAVGAVTLALYALLFKDFVFVSFDPTSARASGFPVRLANGTLFLLIAVSIAICTRAVGAMPVFALTVLPPAAALQIHDRMLPAVITSAAFGAVAAAGGYFLSGLLNLSAGPLIVVVGCLLVGVTWSIRRILDLVVTVRARRQSEHVGQEQS